MMAIELRGGNNMKSYILLIISLFVLVGCGAMEPPLINTEGNTFSSSKNPSVQMKLSREFKHIGSDYKSFSHSGPFRSVPPVIKLRFYIYGQLSNDNFLKKFITIETFELPVGRNWHPETISPVIGGVKDPLKSATVKLGPKNFQYCIKPTVTAGKYTGQYLLDKGITTSRCYMQMLLGRVSDNNVKMYISFYEDISDFREFDIDSCEGWKDKKMLNDKQTKYLKEFEKRAHNSIKIL